MHDNIFAICENKCLVKIDNKAVFHDEIVWNTDLNDYTDEGWYLCPSNFTASLIRNCPVANAFVMLVTKAPNAPSPSAGTEMEMVHRVIFEINTEVETLGKSPKMYFGVYNKTLNKTSDWVKVGAIEPQLRNNILHIGDSQVLLSTIRPSVMGGLSMLKITKEDFEALETKDPNTIYYVTDEGTITQYMGETKLQSGSSAVNSVLTSTAVNHYTVSSASEPEDPPKEV